MEIILAVIAVVVLAFMYKSLREYLANPKAHGPLRGRQEQEEPDYKNYDDPYKNMGDSEESKICSSEYGVLIGLLAKVAQSDGKICELEERLVEELINDIVVEFDNPERTRDILFKHFHAEQCKQGTEYLALEFLRLTKGEYKKRLKVVEFLLMVAYADGSLGEQEREIILDVAAYFELSNEDFNRIYDDFEQWSEDQNKEGRDLDYQQALVIMGLEEHEINEKVLKDRYRELVRQNHPDIIQGKGASQKDIMNANRKLAEINEAYHLLKNKGPL